MTIFQIITIVQKLESKTLLPKQLSDKRLELVIQSDVFSSPETEKTLWAEVDKRRKGNPNFMR